MDWKVTIVEGLLDVLRKTVDKNDASFLEEWLNFYVAKHHDDRSIAVAFDPTIFILRNRSWPL